MTLAQAERAAFGPDGCGRCGGSDIDLAEPGNERRVLVAIETASAREVTS